MEQTITKASLLHELRAARADWDTLMDEVGPARMTEPGAAGDWSAAAYFLIATRTLSNAAKPVDHVINMCYISCVLEILG